MHFHDVEKRKTRRLLPVFSTLPTRSPIFFLMLIELFPPISLIFISLICSQGFLFPCGHRNSLKTLTNERCSPLFDFYVSKSEMRNLTASAFCVHRRSLVASWSYVKWKVVVTSNPEFVCSKLSTCFTTNMNNHILTPLKKYLFISLPYTNSSCAYMDLLRYQENLPTDHGNGLSFN